MLRKVIYICLALMTCMQFQSLAQGKKDFSAMLIDAVTKYNSGDYTGAKEILSSITDADPENDAAYYYLGMCDYYLYDLKSAQVELQEASKLDTANYWYQDRLAALYAVTDQEDKSIQIYEKLLQRYPKKSAVYYSLVNLYARSQRYDKVLETLTSIEAVAGKNESTTTARYDILMHMNKRQEALAVLESFNDEFSSPQVLSLMGDFYVSEDKDSLATHYYKEALAEDSSYTPALLGQSEIYRTQRDFPAFFSAMRQFVRSDNTEAEYKCRYLSSVVQSSDPTFMTDWRDSIDSLVNSCVEIYPSDTSVLSFAGSYYLNTERQDKAVEYFKLNRDSHPDNYGASVSYIQLLSYLDRWKDVADAADYGFAHFPEESAFLETKSMALYYLNDLNGIVENSERILKAFPADSAVTLSTYSTLGDIYHNLGDNAKAYKAYKKALKINPTYAPVLNNYAYFLSLEGKRLSKAYAMSKITVDQEPDNSTYLDTFGWILYLQGKLTEAKPLFKHAMLYGGKESVTVLDHYAEVLYGLKEYDLAQIYWNMALKKDYKKDLPDLEEKIKAKMAAVGR